MRFLASLSLPKGLAVKLQLGLIRDTTLSHKNVLILVYCVTSQILFVISHSAVLLLADVGVTVSTVKIFSFNFEHLIQQWIRVAQIVFTQVKYNVAIVLLR